MRTTKSSVNEGPDYEGKKFKLGTPAIWKYKGKEYRGEVVMNPKHQRVFAYGNWSMYGKGSIKGILTYDKDTFVVPDDWKNVKSFNESVNEALNPKKLTQLKKGEKFVFNNTPFEFIELYTDIKNAARVKHENGKVSVVSFGGGVVNKNTKGGFSDYLKQGGRVWDGVNKSGKSINEDENDTPASPEEMSMAENQLGFIHYAASEIEEYIEEQQGGFPEWLQNKLTDVHSKMRDIHGYIEGERNGNSQVSEAEFGFKDSTASYINNHNDEWKVAEKLLQKAGGNKMKFYEQLNDLGTKIDHPKYMKFISNALRGFKVDMYKDPKIKNQSDAEEALYLLLTSK